jgi:thymidylate synthase
MLAGRNDVAPLSFYSSKIAGIASDDGETFNGAYGYRWRHYVSSMDVGAAANYAEKHNLIFQNQEIEDYDQLSILINHLRNKPDSRRAVLQMWNVEDDLLKIGGEVCPSCNGSKLGKSRDDYHRPLKDGSYGCPDCNSTGLTAGTKDVCCNTCVYFSIRKEVDNSTNDGMTFQDRYLDMTVCNRSNDMILGMLGANVVHFSMLQEYLANCLGVEVGVYNQFTNNLHVYVNNWKPEEWLATAWGEADKSLYRKPNEPPLCSGNQERFDHEVGVFVEAFSGRDKTMVGELEEPWLRNVAMPMCRAFESYKAKHWDCAFAQVEKIESPDWQRAAKEWIQRREVKALAKGGK